MKRPKVFTRPRNTSSKVFNPRKDRDALYDSTWSLYSKIFLNVNKFCYACGEKATVCDHLRPHKGDKELFTMRNNHIPLCKMHHDKITALFDRHEPPKFQEKLEYLASVRLSTGTTLSVKVLPKYGKDCLN